MLHGHDAPLRYRCLGRFHNENWWLPAISGAFVKYNSIMNSLRYTTLDIQTVQYLPVHYTVPLLLMIISNPLIFQLFDQPFQVQNPASLSSLVRLLSCLNGRPSWVKNGPEGPQLWGCWWKRSRVSWDYFHDVVGCFGADYPWHVFDILISNTMNRFQALWSSSIHQAFISSIHWPFIGHSSPAEPPAVAQVTPANAMTSMYRLKELPLESFSHRYWSNGWVIRATTIDMSCSPVITWYWVDSDSPFNRLLKFTITSTESGACIILTIIWRFRDTREWYIK